MNVLRFVHVKNVPNNKRNMTRRYNERRKVNSKMSNPIAYKYVEI
jgi:hypothetical protein